jgi:hypothetical protein
MSFPMRQREELSRSGHGGAGDTSAHDSILTASGDAGGSKNRMMAGAIKGLFRAVIKALTLPSNDTPKPAARKRRGGTGSRALLCVCVTPRQSQHGSKPAACGRYAAMQGNAAAAHRAVSLGMETPADQSGSFNLSLSNPFGGFEHAGGDQGLEDFTAPVSGVNLISLGL